jgi:glycosyltransferase involved in cell wall biosynthesis
MTVRVLIDRHHHALLESLLMLFEDRFGWECFIPYGMDWYDDDIYIFERDYRRAHGWEPVDAVARQYLEGIWTDTWRNDLAPDGSVPIVVAHDPRHPWRTHRGITLDAARQIRWDIVLSSLPHNDVGMARFAKERGAIFGVQVGNESQQSAWGFADFILSSSTLAGHGTEDIGRRFDFMGTPTVMYHQEFDLDVFHHAWPPANRREVASWVNCFCEGPSYPDFLTFARAHADEFDFRVYGSYGRDTGKEDEFAGGDISPVPDVAETMRRARVGWHSKHWSDGFGHTIHNWFAIGRPVIGYRRYYEGKIAGPLWIEGVTGFDLENRTEAELLDLLRRLRDDDDYHRRISENAAARFRAIVDFDAEAEVIKAMLEDVLP